mgnify:CR=1 FL=1
MGIDQVGWVLGIGGSWVVEFSHFEHCFGDSEHCEHWLGDCGHLWQLNSSNSVHPPFSA